MLLGNAFTLRFVIELLKIVPLKDSCKNASLLSSHTLDILRPAGALFNAKSLVLKVFIKLSPDIVNFIRLPFNDNSFRLVG